MSDYSITINNESDVDDRVYLLFQEKPVQNPMDDKQVFYNIFAAAPPLASGDGSQVTFQIHKDLFAVCGTPPAPLAKGVKISTSAFVPVTLAQGGAKPKSGSSVFLTTNDNSPKWEDDKATTTNDAVNGFVINTDDTFEFPNPRHLFIGLGAKDPFNDSKVVPVASIEAQPAQQYSLFPQSIYYICTGTFTQGTIIDIKQVGKKLKLDFTKTTIPDVTFTQNPHGDYVAQDINSGKVGSME